MIRFINAALISKAGIDALEFLRGSAADALKKSKHFTPPVSIYHLVEYAKPIVSIGNQTGEGWVSALWPALFKFFWAVESISLIRFNWFTSLAPGS